MVVQVIQLFNIFLIVLFAVDYVDAGSSTHNENLCALGSVSIFASNNSIYEIGAVQIDIQTQNESGNKEAWITLDFGKVMPISTIAFISESNQNVDNFAAMTRTYGNSEDRHDRETNKVITQSGGTNFPSMIADINEDGPAQIRYIHWQSDKEFKINEILCFEKRRLHQSQFSSIKSYIQGANSAITTLVGCPVEQAEYTSFHYTTENKISRIVGITDNGSFEAAKSVEFSMKDDQGNSNKCNSYSDRAGFDCHQNAMLHTEMEMKQTGDLGIHICSLIFLEDGDEELSRGPLRKLSECTSPNPLQWPQFIDYGNSGRSIEVETFDIAGSEDIVMGIGETDGVGYVRHSVMYYCSVCDVYQWTKSIMNAPEMWMNVYFADSDMKVLLAWSDTTHNPIDGAWTFAFLEVSNGDQIGDFYQQDQVSGKIHHTAIAINQDASSIFVMTNFPDQQERQHVFSRLSFNGSSWSKQLQKSFNQSKRNDVWYYQKNAVFLGFDENFVFTMSSSDGTNQNEDCALMIWDANTFNLPIQNETIMKNNNAKMRNCVYPQLVTDSDLSSTDLWVLTVAEYTPNSNKVYTGFIRYQLSSNYDQFLEENETIKYIPNVRAVITGVYCPNNYQWYAMALYNNINNIIFFDWNDTSVKHWNLSSHDTSHTFSVIKSAIGFNASQLPVTGYYVGGTTSVQSTFGCQYNFSDQVGHISKIELSVDSALDEDLPLNPSNSSSMGTESGNGQGIGSMDPLENVSDANTGVDYLVPVITPFETCSFELESWQSNSMTSLSQLYVINSGIDVETFSYKLSSDDCQVQVEIYQMNESGLFEVHDESILTSVMGTDFGLIQEVDVACATSDINLDSDGTLPSPVISFKIVIASPNVLSSAGETENPIELFLDVTLEHPCRNAVFTTQVVNDMDAFVNGGPVTQTLPAFAHSLDASQYDCGLQVLTFSSDIVTASAQGSSFDSIDIIAESTNYADEGILSIIATVTLEDYPQITFVTSFSVELTVCEIENPIWLATSSTSLTYTYRIDSADTVFGIQFEKNMAACQVEVQIQESDANGGWNLVNIVHNGSVLTSSSVVSEVTETFDVTISTSDLSLDSGGSVAPTKDYKIVVASPNLAAAPGDSFNPVEFNLALTFEHPCRSAVITTQAIESMKALVNHGAVTQDVPPFAHNLDTSAYDCGLQQISILPNPFSSFMSESAQLASGDDLVITIDATDPLISGEESVQIEVSLINFPVTSLTTASFNVNIVACQFALESWQSNSSSDPNQNVGTLINQTYIIDSGVNMRYLLYEKSDSECTVEIEIYEADVNDNWAAHTGSIVTYAMGTDFGQVQTLNVAIATSNLALDSDGTIDSPVFSYKVIVASPSLDEAPGNGQNPIELDLDLTFIHPCRNAVFINQKPDDMTTYINGPQVIQYMAPLAHSMDAYNCGRQEITIPAGQDYTAFMSGSVTSSISPDLRIYAMPTDFNDAGDHFSVATVTLVNFPVVTITTYSFTVTVVCCSVADGTEFSRYNITVNQVSKGIIDTISLYTYEFADDTHTILRQSPDYELGFVEIDTSEGLPQIVIKPTRDEVPRNYDLVLETIYFQEWNDYTLVLQTDTISITVLSEFFVEEPQLIELDMGQEETWTVDALDTSITIDYTHISLGSSSPFVQFDSQTFEFSTIAEEMTETYVGSHRVELKVKSKNQKSLFIIFVIVGGSGETDELFDSSLPDLVNELEELEQEPYVYPHAGLRPDGDLPPPLQTKLSEIQPSGQIKLMFSRPVQINTDFLDRQIKMRRSLNAAELNATDLNATDENTGLFGSLGPEERNKLLAEQFGFRLIHPDAEMEVYPEIQDFHIKEVAPTSFNFQLNISNPDAISSVFQEPCTVDFKIEMNALIDPERQGIIELEQVDGLNDIVLPHMMDKKQAIQLQNTAQATSGITASLFSVNMLIALAIGMSLKLVWGALNTLQIIVLLAEIDANLAAHAAITLKELKTIALFEFIPYKWFGTQLKMMVTRSRHEAEYEENMVDSMGAMIIIGCVLIAISLLSLILGSLGFWLHNKAYSKVINLIKRKLYWNCFIRYSLQSYLKISFVCFAGLSTLTWDATWFEYARSTAILLACIALAILPFIYGVTLRDKQALSQRKVKKKIGSLNQGIRNFRHMQALYSVFFLLRRMIFVIVLLKLKDYPSLVVSSTIILNFFNIMYLGIIEPHSSMFYQIIELFNETFLQLIICFFAISMMSPGIDFGKGLGWALISFIVALIMVNLVCIIGKTLIEGKWYVHIYKLKKALDKRRKAKKEQKLRRALERIHPQGQTVETARALMAADNQFYSEESETPKQKTLKVLEEISEVASQAEISCHYLPFQQDQTPGQLNVLAGMMSKNGETMQHSWDENEHISVDGSPRIVPITRPSKNVDDLVIPSTQSMFILPSDSQWHGKEEVKVADIRELLSAASSRTGRTGRSGKVSPEPHPYYMADNLMHSRSDVAQAQAFKQGDTKFNNSGKNWSKQLTKDPVMMQKQICGGSTVQVDKIHPSSREADFLNSSDGFSDLCQANRMNFVAGLKDFHQSGSVSPKNTMQHQFLEQEINSNFMISLNQCKSVKFEQHEQSQQDIDLNRVHQNSEILEADDRTEDSVKRAYQLSAEPRKELEPQEMQYQERQVDPSKQVGIMRYLTQVENSKKTVTSKKKKTEAKSRNKTGVMADAYGVQYEKRKTEKKKTSKFKQDSNQKPSHLTK